MIAVPPKPFLMVKISTRGQTLGKLVPVSKPMLWPARSPICPIALAHV